MTMGIIAIDLFLQFFCFIEIMLLWLALLIVTFPLTIESIEENILGIFLVSLVGVEFAV